MRAGGYLMVYMVHPDEEYPDEQARLAAIEIRLARSADGVNWVPQEGVIARGSVPAIVEAADGTLYLFYVDASHRVRE